MNGQEILWIDYAIVGLFLVVLYMYLFPRIQKKLRGDINYISPQELKMHITNEDDILVIDMRRENEFNGISGHIENAVNIPLKSIPEKLQRNNESLESLKDTKVIIVGFKGSTEDLIGYNLFKNHGFNNISLLENGMSGWIKKKFPTEKVYRS